MKMEENEKLTENEIIELINLVEEKTNLNEILQEKVINAPSGKSMKKLSLSQSHLMPRY